jgi:hypothetical protein
MKLGNRWRCGKLYAQAEIFQISFEQQVYWASEAVWLFLRRPAHGVLVCITIKLRKLCEILDSNSDEY